MRLLTFGNRGNMGKEKPGFFGELRHAQWWLSLILLKTIKISYWFNIENDIYIWIFRARNWKNETKNKKKIYKSVEEKMERWKMLVTPSAMYIYIACLADPTNFDHIAQILQSLVKDSEVGGNETRIGNWTMCVSSTTICSIKELGLRFKKEDRVGGLMKVNRNINNVLSIWYWLS
jgi:hypothetical protein